MYIYTQIPIIHKFGRGTHTHSHTHTLAHKHTHTHTYTHTHTHHKGREYNKHLHSSDILPCLVQNSENYLVLSKIAPKSFIEKFVILHFIRCYAKQRYRYIYNQQKYLKCGHLSQNNVFLSDYFFTL